MLHVIQDSLDPYYARLLEDPVRPEIPSAQRLGANRSVFAWLDQDHCAAMLCCRYMDSVPQTSSELFQDSQSVNTAVFYTIWSYRRGAGQSLILAARSWITANKPEITKFLTLSPSTDLARQFHLRNGAGIYRINSDTVNYIYE